MGSTRQQRSEVYYSGHVQGVGFRFTSQQIAKGFNVTGFVRNLSDGRVSLVVEGEAAEIRRFLGEIDVQLGGYIRDAKIADLAASGEFSGFSIRH
ncbi:MAG: acylphosphatase [Planctomycetaceae bacterium]|nr:acylphosphatase [Planctomycetales bacterium]MCB9923385.1 acylphosphatase [Planctomycetaceae bacterium]